MNKEDILEPEEIFSGSLWEAEIIQGLLNSGGIESFVKDDITGSIAPWRMMTSEVESVKLLVLGKEATNAKAIIAEYRK
ncbi:MAG TPA: DUF2007-related protein [Sphingobacteriaceae bacterium]|nr:DUF2007-related protein [Sphingobacteriaceae bacterium]